ncbi:ETS-related transcription factor Elf-3-like [Gigantopelta aegis]|uniref:ETS-related transcription factor Elf-3-like n=1 Tax=Gigantopelta aegis TaxID=1735272 RepID=UPI001B889018|nr:ETS-related transcription factor Elf-3-like [Gigantopelta aegis]XP_041366540.1 ETS-related transcription factor Elf-3-like [Gigantopelta aegis]
MPSASPLYNFPAMTGEADCAYRVPSTDCFQDTRFPSGYDPFQSLSAMAAQTFTGNAPISAGSSCQSTHFNGLPSNMQQLNNCASPVTPSPPQYLTSTSSAYCMYSASSDSRRSSNISMSDDSCQLGISKKTFPSPADDMYEEQDGFLSWTRKHPEHWSCKEVLDWLFFLGQEKGLDMSELRGEGFQNLTGSQLCRLTEEEFFQIDPKFGKLFYEMLKKMLLSGVIFTKPEISTPELQELTSFNPTPCESASRTFQSCSSPVYHELVRKEDHPQQYTGFQLPEGYMKPERQDVLPSDVIDIGPYDFDLNDPPSLPPATGNGVQTYPNYCQPEMEIYNHPYSTSMTVRNFNISQGHFPQQLPRRRPGRPRVKSLPEDVARSHKDKKVKNQHLWEFIYEALMNPLYNPQFLRWENQREGVFRFVQSEAVAQLWGSLKSNDNMTYEKLSRAMRHYYKRGILERVEGRRLVYKFSLKAMERVREKRHNSV